MLILFLKGFDDGAGDRRIVLLSCSEFSNQLKLK